MTTRRDLRLKFEEILKKEAVFCSDGLENESPYKEKYSDLAKKLADCALEPMFDMDKAGVEWGILAGAEIKQETVDAAVLEKEAIDAFESAFGANWVWYPAKPQEERVWAWFRAFLVKLYQVDKDCFTKYFTWAHQPFSRGAMTGRQIKSNPQDFKDSWASFCMSTKYAPRQIVPDSERTDLDDTGAPISYM